MQIKKNSVISQEELDKHWQELTAQTAGTGENPYELYIRTVKEKEELNGNSENNPQTFTEKHHIIPKHAGGDNSPANIVRLSVKEHVVAHWLRWKVFGSVGDKLAVLFRCGNTEEALSINRALVAAARERDRAEGVRFFDSAFQREMSRRGSSLGGGMNTQSQFLARQRVGRTYGRQTGISNQSDLMRTFLSNYAIWAYRPSGEAPSSAGETQTTGPRSSEEGLIMGDKVYLIGPKPAFRDVASLLNLYVPGSVRNVSSMHKLVSNERKQMYGWRIISKPIRSEIEKGIEDFNNRYPGFLLNLEEDFYLEFDLE